MKALFSLLVLATQVAFASNSYKTVTLSECIQAHHIEVDMLSPKAHWGGATVVLKGMAKAFDQVTATVDRDRSLLAACEVTLEKSGDDVLADVSFDPDLEDGRNACFVNFKFPNGKLLTAELYIDVIDF